MKFWKLISAVTAALVVSTSANAALVGRLAATTGGTDYQAYYDTDADLTWLANANAAGTYFNWAAANSWAADLVVGGNDNWRLADADTTCSGRGCTGGEMGNLFYNVLGGRAESRIADVHNSNYNLFSNVQSDFYWSATESYPYNGTQAWLYDMYGGIPDYYGVDQRNGYAWAVQSGDVSAVPVPAAVWLFGSGLVGLVGLARRKKA